MLGMLILCVSLGVVGVVLIALGRHGRRLDDHPTCRRCGFDLIGTPEPRGTCPECGASLNQAKAVRRGNHQRYPAAVWLGAALLLTTALPAGELAVGGHWEKYKPLWLVRLEARHTGWPQAVAALDELERRVQSGALSSAEINAVLDDALAVQADASRPWPERWGDVVLDIHQVGGGTQGRFDRYARALFHIGLMDPKRAPLSTPMMRVGIRLTTGRGLWSWATTPAIAPRYELDHLVWSIDGHPHPLGLTLPGPVSKTDAEICEFEVVLPPRLSSGRHVTALDATLRLTRPPSAVSYKANPVFSKLTLHTTGTLEVPAPDIPLR